MAHTHNIKDGDAFFEVNPITRQIINKTPAKIVLMQKDHNSERFTFCLPRYIEGHDMAESAKANLHYVNLTKPEVNGMYQMPDLQIDPENEENVKCSWLISGNVTKEAGALSFLIEFECYDGDVLVYNWHTQPHKGISIGETFDNEEEIAIRYADILAQWEQRLFAANADGVKNITEAAEEAIENITTVKNDALAEFETAGGTLLEYEHSPNLLNLNSVQEGKVILRGGLYDGANYNTTDYIPCKAGDTIRHQFDYQKKRYDNEESTATRMARIEAYDDTKKYIVDSMKTDAKVYVVPDGASFVRISYLTTQWGKTATNNAVIICDRPTLYPYSEYGALIDTSLKAGLRPKGIVKAFLPKEICVAVGRTIELYNNQVCLNAEKYHMQWNCTIGKSLERKFSIEGTTGLIGEYPLTLSIVDDNLDIVWVGSTKIKVVAASTETFSICCIGDSLTNNKPWLAELKTLNSNINLVGTKGISDRKHEGRSGFSAHSYLNATNYTFESEGIHPFWNADAERFDWNYYVTNSLGGVSPDAVQIFLGTNKISLDATENTTDIKQIVDYIRQDDANIPIFIVNTLYRSNQNGIGGQTNTDGYNAAKGAFKYEEDVKVQNLMIGLDRVLGNYANVYFVPVATCHDSANNYGKVEVAVNPRATDKECVPIESVHPQEQGYLQMADIIFSSLSAHMTE